MGYATHKNLCLLHTAHAQYAALHAHVLAAELLIKLNAELSMSQI